MEKTNQLLLIVIFIFLSACQNSVPKETVETSSKKLNEQSQFDKEIEALENVSAFEKSLQGKWVLQKLTVQSKMQNDELIGSLANQSFIILGGQNKLNGSFSLAGQAITGEGIWHINHENKIIYLQIGNIIDGRGRKREEHVLIESKIKNIKNNYANLEVIKMTFGTDELTKDEMVLTAIVKKE